jgi:hypothetical protein
LNARRIVRNHAGREIAVVTTQAVLVGAVLVADVMTVWLLVGSTGAGEDLGPILALARELAVFVILFWSVLLYGLLLFGLPAWLFAFPIVWIWGAALRHLVSAKRLAV